MIGTRRFNVDRIPTRAWAFPIGFLAGIISLLLDVDHLLLLWWKNLPVTFVNLTTQAGRPLHIPALLVVSAFYIYCVSRIDRLLENLKE